ncbi:hypothetical protein AHMF7605_01550 [Adhaeribacter arboris]|uniref:Uncharacterized protein n=1 Tax=Adhaeribacter arboris TaxID=2072846 RepID=A0A2T2Y9W6_9BACT|nr:hypothetical protein [Adhaeribacter arboris]PSR52297.1 hypothetical protein AHMF7605_01550 [Adhaeribacter arboris]
MNEEISDGWTILFGQTFLLIFFTPFNSLLFYTFFKNISLDGLIFTLVMVAPSILFIRYAFYYAEITLTDNFIIIKKRLKVKKVPVTKYKTIGKGIPASSYYIEFENKKTVYFLLNYTDAFRDFFSLDPDKVLKELKMKFEQAKENNKSSAANTA